MEAEFHGGGNCGITDLIGFDRLPKKLSIDWLLHALAADNSYRNPNLRHSNIIRYSGNATQRVNLDRFTDWLISQKQEVQSTGWLKNKNTGRMIKAFTWVPSKAFTKKLEAKSREMMKTGVGPFYESYY